MSINKVILIGNVGNEPETKTFESGSQLVTFSLATSETYKDKDGKKQSKTEWHNIVIWGKLANVVENYIHKGDKLYLEGKITTEKWQDKYGNDKYTTKIVCNQMTMLGSKSSESNPKEQENENLPNWLKD